jgi:hypothetical protein
MLRPSPTLASRLGLKSIHKPLPLNNRDAHKLLGLLQSSFRKHLEAEYGASNSTVEDKSTNSSPPKSPITRPDPRQHYADRHFEALLSNPLFTSPIVPKSDTVDPHDMFDSRVAAGTMNLDYATQYLNTFYPTRDIYSIKSAWQGLKKSGAGSRVLKWLLSSGSYNDLEFLEHVAFTQIMLRFLVVEDLQDMAWEWVTRSFIKSSSPSTTKKPLAINSTLQERLAGDSRFPLAAYVRAELHDGTGMESACALLGKASSYLEESGFLRSQRDWIVSSAQLIVVEHHLSRHSTTASVSEEAFQTLLTTLPGRLGRRKSFEYQMAHLLLLHPTKPSANPALEVLSKWQPASDVSSAYEITAARKLQKERSTVIKLGLDLAHFLLEHNRMSEADWVMDFLRSNFPIALGESQKRALSDATAEASSLDLLGALDMKIA